MKELLRVKGLRVNLLQNARPIVKGMDFTLRESSALAIVGESGSGKTMTCKSVMRLLNPKIFTLSGSVRYRETELLALEEKAIRKLRGSEIAMIMQNPMSAFDPTCKIGAQIAETIRTRQKVNKRTAYAAGIRALENMNLPRCEHLMNSYPHALSGGMLQRIMIAITLLHEPDIIIADEATTALDVINQNVILDELAKMKERGIGLLIVTHDFGVAAKLADEVIVMRDGKIVEQGAADEVFANPKEYYTKELLEAGNLIREEEQRCLTSLTYPNGIS
jgi:ABC-type dipeptide/oligopeptide/nickel transport system ATPase component